MKPYEVALSEYGTMEFAGSERNNPQILKYFHMTGFSFIEDDETAWCSAFINYCCLVAGYERSMKLNARSWLDVGKHEKKGKLGDIVVLWRVNPDSEYGHVGFYINEDSDSVYLLSGNQSNMVNILKYPKDRILEFRSISPLNEDEV